MIVSREIENRQILLIFAFYMKVGKYLPTNLIALIQCYLKFNYILNLI